MPRLDPVLQAVESGHSALLVSGNYFDYTVAGSRIAFRRYHLADLLAQDRTVIRYSRGRGPSIHNFSNLDSKIAKAVTARLRALGINVMGENDKDVSAEETVRFFRNLGRLLMVPPDGYPPFALIIEYAEDVAPVVSSAAAAATEHTIVAESLHSVGISPALSKSGNLLICVTRDELHSKLLNDLHHVVYPLPSEDETSEFVQLAMARRRDDDSLFYPELEPGLSPKEFGRITRGLPLRDIEQMLLEARANGDFTTRKLILSAKAENMMRISEGTLSVMSTDMTIDDIVGLHAVKRTFSKFADKLREGHPSSPRAILMVGPPGTAKSTFAPLLAQQAGFNIVQLEDVKNMYVGESERRMNLAIRLIESLAPVILFIDEITEMTPSRRENVGDSGVSQNLLGRLFQFSAREDLRGKVLLMAASNVAERLDPAWHDRFVCVPFLELVPNEMVELVASMARRINPGFTLDPASPEISSACQLLHKKGVSPRKTYDILNHALLLAKGEYASEAEVLEAAKRYTGVGNPMAVAYTSLSAISLTSFRDFLPWYDDPKNYQYPWYLEQIVDKETGEIDRHLLNKRINEYKQSANI